MSKNRRKSLAKNKLERGSSGRYLCRFCQVEVKPPRRTFCSDKCVHEWRIRSSSSYARTHIFNRDGGVCAKCGVNTMGVQAELKQLKKAIVQEWHSNPIDDWDVTYAKTDRLVKDVRWIEACSRYRLDPEKVDLSMSPWDADHIKPVVEGGGECGLDNFRTLCKPCHKEETAALRKRMAEAKKLAKGGGNLDGV